MIWEERKIMQYQNPFWGMMNYDYIQQKAQQYHMGQVRNTYECAHKLKDCFGFIITAL